MSHTRIRNGVVLSRLGQQQWKIAPMAHRTQGFMQQNDRRRAAANDVLLHFKFVPAGGNPETGGLNTISQVLNFRVPQPGATG